MKRYSNYVMRGMTEEATGEWVKAEEAEQQIKKLKGLLKKVHSAVSGGHLRMEIKQALK